jgi:hypothetical protein
MPLIPWGSRLNDPRVRDLYMALSEDRITSAPFWEAYTKATVLRNAVIHQGARANPRQAREAIDTATQMTGHILATLQKPKPPPERWTTATAPPRPSPTSSSRARSRSRRSTARTNTATTGRQRS